VRSARHRKNWGKIGQIIHWFDWQFGKMIFSKAAFLAQAVGWKMPRPTEGTPPCRMLPNALVV
jgi:hypothetical protein